ncbi:Neurotrophin receptor-interacting factor [Manis javanica]|nr:Neurotrophin receptor-interacting factor [Manis javanica]
MENHNMERSNVNKAHAMCGPLVPGLHLDSELVRMPMEEPLFPTAVTLILVLDSSLCPVRSALLSFLFSSGGNGSEKGNEKQFPRQRKTKMFCPPVLSGV